MNVRDATLADLPALVTMYEQLMLGPDVYQPTDRTTAEAVFHAMEGLPGHHLLVAELPDLGVAGTLQLMVIPSVMRGRPFAIIESVVVDAPARRRGVGRALLDEAVARAVAADCYKVELQSRLERNWAHPFYEAAGFSPAAAGFKRFLD